MRSIVTSIIILLLLCGCASAQDVLTLSAHELTAGEELTIEALDAAEKRSFTLFRDGEQVNTGAVTEAKHAAMIPQVPGQYVLSMQPEGGQPVTAAFTVYDRLSVTLRVDLSSVKIGEPITLKAEAVGGTEKKEYEYSVWRGTERIERKTGAENSCVYIPLAEGSLTFSVEVTDGLGGKVSAVADPVTVQGPAGMAVSGDLSPMFVQGGIRGLKVESPGPWSARTEQGFVTLLNTCGDSGDVLYYAVDASGIGERSAVVNIESLGLSRRVTLRQSAEYAEETEVMLFSSASDWVKAEGKTALSYLFTAEENDCTVGIEAGGSWYAETDADFVHVQQDGDQLILRIEENVTGAHRTANVYVHSGNATAAIAVSQTRREKGASVQEVVMNRDRGLAYQDEIGLRIATDATAQSVSVRIDQAEPLVYDLSSAERTENGLVWHISVPLTGAGAQSWLISAMNESGSGSKALATVSVEGEAPAFRDAPETSADGSQVCVYVTQNAEKIEALDAENMVLRTYTVRDARIDRTADESGRYAQWTLPVSGGLPAALKTGDAVIGLTWPEITAEENGADAKAPSFTLYSQMDGTWKNKSYRKSNLEKSGCAIFALSHALQLLGHHEPESLPEQLAVTYAFCLVDGGTLNSTLIGNAGKAFGYKTRFKLYNDKKEITKRLSKGALFSFGIVDGHIALIDRLSKDGNMCHIIDSAPSATFSRISGETPYLYNEKSGKYVPLSSPAEIPGVRYYVDTEGYDGAEYWLPLKYVAERGVRLIQKK